MNNYFHLRILSANRRHRLVMDYTSLIVYASLALEYLSCAPFLKQLFCQCPHMDCNFEKDSKLEKTWSMLKADDAVKPLTAILTLNTISHTVGAAGVGKQVYLIWQDGAFAGIKLQQYPTSSNRSSTITLRDYTEDTGFAFWRQLAPTAGKILKLIIPTMAILIIPIQAMKKILPEQTSD